MANCYKNFPVIIEYSDGTSGVMYGATVSIEESIDLQSAESLGTKGSSAVFNSSLTKGSLTVEGFLTDPAGVSGIVGLQGSNDQNIQIQAGPYVLPKPCIMDSVSIDVNVGEPVSCSRSFSFFGAVVGEEWPAASSSPLSGIIPKNVSLSGYDSIAGSNIISSVNWQVSQQYDAINLLGNPDPTIVFQDGQITLDIDGEGLTIPLTSDGGEVCVLPPKDYAVTLSGCAGLSTQTLPVTSGYMTRRGISIAPGRPQSSRVSIVQYL